jgi:hypothetical protein
MNIYFILKLFEGSVFGMETPLEVLFFSKKVGYASVCYLKRYLKLGYDSAYL